MFFYSIALASSWGQALHPFQGGVAVLIDSVVQAQAMRPTVWGHTPHAAAMQVCMLALNCRLQIVVHIYMWYIRNSGKTHKWWKGGGCQRVTKKDLQLSICLKKTFKASQCPKRRSCAFNRFSVIGSADKIASRSHIVACCSAAVPLLPAVVWCCSGYQPGQTPSKRLYQLNTNAHRCFAGLSASAAAAKPWTQKLAHRPTPDMLQAAAAAAAAPGVCSTVICCMLSIN